MRPARQGSGWRGSAGAGVVCVVAAPSKLQRPAGDRVKTDARDARHLARLLHLGEIVEVAIPSVEQEAARDLVRAREDVPWGLDVGPAPGVETAVAARDHLFGREAVDRQARGVAAAHTFDTAGLQLAYDTAFDTMLATVDRRNRLETAIAEMAADSPYTPGAKAGMPARGLDIDRVRAGGGDRGLGSD